jgi:hypothetical protein
MAPTTAKRFVEEGAFDLAIDCGSTAMLGVAVRSLEMPGSRWSPVTSPDDEKDL